MNSLFSKKQKGFTLLEILLVVAAIGILAGIVLVAINPARQLAQTRNAQRKVDVNTILNAVYQYIIDENGDLPGDVGAIPDEDDVGAPDPICQSDVGGLVDGSCTGVDLSDVTADELYLVAFPIDPSCDDDGSTCYEIEQTDNGRIRVSAPLGASETADSQTISVTR